MAFVSVFLPRRMDGGRRTIHPAANGEFGDGMQCVGEGAVAAVYARNGEGVVFADDILRALLAVRHQVAVGQVVAGKTLVTGNPSTLAKSRDR